jgi:NADH-quinone oxidoreductase subunit N
MNIEWILSNYGVLLPEAVLTLFAFAIILIGLKYRSILGYLAFVGGVVSLGLVIMNFSVNATLLYNSLVFDPLSQFFKVVFLLVTLLTIIASLRYYHGNAHQGEYYFLLLIATVGMMFVASANDLVSLFVAFELGSIATYVLAAFDKENPRSIEAGFKYFMIGALSSAILLLGMSLIYGITGTTNFTALSQMSFEMSGYTLAALVLIIAGLGFKMALVPFHMWAPDTYQGAPTVVSAMLAAGSKKMGFVAAFKLIVLALIALRTEWYMVFAVIAVITMTYGNLVALTQRSLKRMLAYSSIAQAGYIAMALVVVSYTHVDSVVNLAMGGALFYILSHAFMKGGAFLAVGTVGYMLLRDKIKVDEDDIDNFSGLSKTAPITAFSLTVFLFALAGIPLTAGFVSKLLIFSAAIYGGLAWLAVIAILNSALSLFYYARVVKVMYWDKPKFDLKGEPTAYVVAVLLALLGTVLLGVYPGPFVDVAMKVAEVFL